MTDFQFKAIMTMVLEIANSTDDIDKIRKAFEKLATGKLTEGANDE
ncbi:MAG: hypothetical protein FWE00_00285 [Defluviitaleaceae bacterium]|nr:hypothetical protein [Defluviitaleaceae bacterium]